jgi:hypothetical protein
MTDRLRLPNRRASESFDLRCGGLRYVATVSRFPDGGLAEIFLTNGKAGSQADANAAIPRSWLRSHFSIKCPSTPFAKLCCAMGVALPQRRWARRSI